VGRDEGASMRTIIYGDVHGCLEELKTLREELDIVDGDTEILVGDILDRGPFSNETLTYARQEKLRLVLGNHERKYVRYKKHDERSKATGKRNPMRFNESKLFIYENMSEENTRYLEEAPFFIKIDNVTVLHAGITNKIDLQSAKQKDLESLLMIRTLDENQKILRLGQTTWNARFWSEWYNGDQGIIVYGHEAFDKVKIDKYSFGVDTGRVYGNKLTALVIYDTKEPMLNYDIVQVNAFAEYALKK
jgi:predicted phosphodiesterase